MQTRGIAQLSCHYSEFSDSPLGEAQRLIIRTLGTQTGFEEVSPFALPGQPLSLIRSQGETAIRLEKMQNVCAPACRGTISAASATGSGIGMTR
jgi:hypothetical protein